MLMLIFCLLFYFLVSFGFTLLWLLKGELLLELLNVLLFNFIKMGFVLYLFFVSFCCVSFDFSVVFVLLSSVLFFLSFGCGVEMSFVFYDFSGWFMSLLSFLIVFLIFLVMSGFMSMDGFGRLVSFFYCLMLIFLFLAFGSSSLFFLFFFFECCILPIFFLILGWGSGDGRFEASMYMFLYTMTFSLPFFILLFYFHYFGFGSLCFSYLFYYNFLYFSFLLVPFCFLIFFVKLPVFFLHFWLPSAHVEAPTHGSMILAAVLLKLGSYGIFSLFLLVDRLVGFFLFVFYFLGLFGGIYSALVSFFQVDLSRMVAYMSVSHMGILLSGLCNMKCLGWLGAFFFMVGHGLVSSGLFFSIGVSYDRLMSRSIGLVRGLLSFNSFFGLFLFMVVACNISFPPSLGFFSEILLFWGLLSLSLFGSPFVFILVLIGCVYSVHFYVSFLHGGYRVGLFSLVLSVREKLVYLFHLFLLFGAFLFFSF